MRLHDINRQKKLVSFLELRGVEVLNTITSLKLPPPEQAVAIPPVCSDYNEKTLYNFFERRQAMWPLLIPLKQVANR